MKTTAEKSITASRSQQQSGPFFAKSGSSPQTGAGGAFFAPTVQAKLTVGKPGDKFEQEADSMAEKVVQRPSMPGIQRKCSDCEEKEKVQMKPLVDGITPFVQRKEESEEEEAVQAKQIQRKEGGEEEEAVQAKRIQLKEESEEEEAVQAKQIQRKEGGEEEEAVRAKRIQRKEESGEEEAVQAKQIQRKEGGEEEETLQTKSATGPSIFDLAAVENMLQASKGMGSRLPANVQQDMEAGFGVDMGNVRIHTHQTAVDMSQQLNAQAFTHGWDVYFNRYKFNPNSTDGKLLLAHELAHTLQQAKANGQTLRPAASRLEQEIPTVPSENMALEAANQLAKDKAAEIGEQQTDATPPPPPNQPAPGAKPLTKTTGKENPSLPPCKPPKTSVAKPVAKPSVPAPQAAATPAPQETPAPPAAAVSAQKNDAEPPAIAKESPKCPAADPAFLKAKKQIGKDAKKQRAHEPAELKKNEMVASAALPTSEQNVQSGQEQQAENLEKAAAPKPFDRLEFKNKLKEKIESKMPETEDQAKDFAGSGKLEQAKEEFKGTISEEKEKVSGPLEQTAAQTLPAGQNLKPDNIAVPNAKPADKPTNVPSGLAAPKPRTDAEISLEYKSKELDDQMANEGLTERQLAESEEPKFEQALQSKKDAQREIAAAPGHYRQVEEQKLAQTQKQADHKTGHELRNMAATKTGKTSEVFGGQKAKETATEKRQREIKEKIDGIYTQTETDVKKILEDLSITVEATFSEKVEAANETFKSRVRSRLDDHYGWFTFDDKIAEWAGLSDGVAHIFKEEKERFLNTMDFALDEIATTVETELNKALARIQLGRTDLEDFKKTLSEDELKFADDLFAETIDKFTELESSVNESQDELIESLSDAYVESVNKLQEEFDKINEELSASWIADAFSFIGEVATAIKKLGELLSSIASRIGQYINQILDSPKRFFNNLVDGIKSGLDDFRDNIETYMEQGFWMWLTGASGGTNIQIPKNMDAQGMFSLATQILGLTKDFILERIKEKLKIPVDAFLALVDKAESVGAKILEPVKILITQGVGALWVWVKNEVSSHLTEIFNKLKTDIFQAIIKKFLVWVASLFIPGLGFIKLIQAAYKALRWLVDNIDRIVDIVNSFLDAVGLAVLGNVSAIKSKVVKALKNGVVIAIDFLAKLVGLGNFAEKLKRGIEMLRKPIRKVIDLILIKAKPIVRKIQKAIAKGIAKVKGGVKKGIDKGKAAAAKFFDWLKAEKKFSGKDGKVHRLFLKGKDEKAALMVASVTSSFEKFIDNINPSGNPEKEAAKRNAIPIAASVDREKARIPATKGLTKEAAKKLYVDKKDNINRLLNDLSVPVAVLMDGKELPNGSYDKPIPIRWTKRGLVEDLHNLVPVSQRWTSKKMTPPSPISVANFKAKTWIEIPPTMKNKFPSEEPAERDGQPIRRVKIGIDEKFFPKVNKRIQRTSGRSDSVKNRFRNSLLPNYGHDFTGSGYDMDHVQDMGFGGKDAIPNLWPLYENMNRNFGTMIYDQVVTYTDESNKPKLSTPKNLIGKWFIIESIGDAEKR
ncbi:MAG: DUF4157 domain-containing protein [Bacteroidetes bacterium]|nr:DUF4157 domain-containing protein [Bacteroidota bacterium]